MFNKVLIVGGGNVGVQMAVHFAVKGFNVWILTSEERKLDRIAIVDEEGEVINETKNFVLTCDKKKAVEGADLILITRPAFLIKKTIDEISDFLMEGVSLGFVPAIGGGELNFNNIQKKVNVFGLERVPSVARMTNEYGVVKAVGYRNKLKIAFLNESLLKISKLFEMVFNIKCEVVDSYLSLTLTPSNPLLHTSRLYDLFSDYRKGKVYSHVSNFYEGWTLNASNLLFAMDSELQNLVSKIKEDLPSVEVVSLREHYESRTSEELMNKIRSISGFKGLKSPTKIIHEGG